MHKLGAVLAQASTINPGDKVHLGGRGPWPRIQEVKFTRGKVMLKSTKKQAALPVTAFVRVVRDV